ncbi:MAG: phytoene desaturase [Candidatus Kapabacteria bacterium]|nr:phytoene desaturase [Candidatus Kapabacteria bacterium]
MHTVVVGAGIGGLVTATLLARYGHNVTLLEQASEAGGKMGRATIDGCTFDTGPSLITMPFVLDAFFRHAGTTLQEQLQLIPIDPGCHYRWSDGSRLDIPFSAEAIPEAVGGLSPSDSAAMRRYLDHAATVYRATGNVFIFSAFEGFKEFIKPRNASLLPMLPRLRFTQSMHAMHASMFQDRRIVQLMDRFATYNGSTPYRAPATLAVIPHVEFQYGAWYPRGGVYAIAQGCERQALANGVTIRYDTAVTRIVHDGRRVSGVVTADGELISADVVVSNVDVHVTQSMLLGQSARPPRDPSMSGFIMLMSVAKQELGLQHHNVLFSDDYQREFHDIVERHTPASDMTIYLSRSAHTDPTQAPPDRENWFVLVNAPATGRRDGSWHTMRDAYAERILGRMRHFGIDPVIRAMEIRTPDDMVRMWNADRGSLYGASSNSMFSAFLRPRQRSKQFTNLWYVGGSAHPGGGVPLVATSGMLAASGILGRPFSIPS